MKTFKDMTPMERMAALRKSGITLFPNLSREEKTAILYNGKLGGASSHR